MSNYVVFFGGYQASESDMNLWTTSAQQQRSDVKFDTFPYPGHADWSDTGAVHGFEKQFDGVVQKIKDCGADTVFIVGHSSGCAIANKLNSKYDGDHSAVTLVDLDGFAPTADQIKGSNVQAWCAEGAGGKGHSLHWAKEKKKFVAGSATQVWSLHFSMVNIAATDAITRGNYTSTGYAGCIANLCWLPPKNP
jgi:hypothetical protein